MRNEYDFCYPAFEYYPHEHLGPTNFNPIPPRPLPPPEPERRVGYVDEEQRPAHRPPLLAPIPPKLPPKHTQIQPRCFTCKHFEMCQYKKDYLKTVTLVQNSLGAPAFDYEMTTRYVVIPNFIGFSLVNQDNFFPKEVKFKDCENDGKLFLSKFNGINYVNIVYKDKKYYILLQFVYNGEKEKYELKSCEEAFYKVEYELEDESLEEIQKGLSEWRVIIINAKAPLPQPKKDIIDTTHFSASLECDLYDWNKDSFEDAIKKIIKKYPNGVPISEDDRALYHIATYHIAEGEVPYAPLFYGKRTPKAKKYCQSVNVSKRSLKRRGDL